MLLAIKICFQDEKIISVPIRTIMIPMLLIPEDRNNQLNRKDKSIVALERSRSCQGFLVKLY